jgi:6,7-dimethyl-8-ribityllumazine synthase
MGKSPFSPAKISGTGLKIGVITARWNSQFTSSLRNYTLSTLQSAEVHSDDILEMSVPGAFELPYACSKMFSMYQPDVIIAIGVLIKGETMHFEYIANSTSKGLMDVSLNHSKPVVFGVLTCLTEEQAGTRASDNEHNHGIGWAQTAIEMASLKLTS